MLKERVMSAVLMSLVFVSVVFFLPAFVFKFFIAAVFLVGAWEWSRMSLVRSPIVQAVYVLLVAALGAGLWFGIFSSSAMISLHTFLMVSTACWALGFLWVQGYPSSRILWGHRAVKLAIGFWVLIPAWIAAVYLREQLSGRLLILSVVMFVAFADTGAYFSGRKFGGRKLAPKISPGKTWAGVIGGAFAASLFGIMFAYGFEIEGWFWRGAAIGIPLALISVIGDLFESMFKREAEMKDSSRIIPGHGGVMDRIDGLVAAAPLFALIVLSMPPVVV